MMNPAWYDNSLSTNTWNMLSDVWGIMKIMTLKKTFLPDGHLLQLRLRPFSQLHASHPPTHPHPSALPLLLTPTHMCHSGNNLFPPYSFPPPPLPIPIIPPSILTWLLPSAISQTTPSPLLYRQPHAAQAPRLLSIKCPMDCEAGRLGFFFHYYTALMLRTSRRISIYYFQNY